jgi:DNA processing protein
VWALVDLDEALDRFGVADPRAAAAALRERARRAIADGEARGFGLVVRGEPDYPALLERIPDPPPVLWARGSVTASEPAVAIVGSRVASPHGLEMGFRLGRDLARAGILVVSGLARGIDAAAHTGALRAGGRTAAVLGCGVDIAYPAEHDRLAQEIAASGSVMSEFAPGTPPSGWHFPRRNRIISGLSLGVVIVEAAHHSGSLITARCALDQGRSVMAVPGPVLSGRNRGAHALLRDGATMVEEASDVIEALRADWMRAAVKGPPGMGSDSIPQGPTGIESDPILRDPVVRRMQPGETYTLEDLALQTGLGPADLLGRLARLEVDGQVRRVEGGRFVKAGPNVLR